MTVIIGTIIALVFLSFYKTPEVSALVLYSVPLLLLGNSLYTGHWLVYRLMCNTTAKRRVQGRERHTDMPYIKELILSWAAVVGLTAYLSFAKDSNALFICAMASVLLISPYLRMMNVNLRLAASQTGTCMIFALYTSLVVSSTVQGNMVELGYLIGAAGFNCFLVFLSSFVSAMKHDSSIRL